MFRFPIFNPFRAPRSLSRRTQFRLRSGGPRGDNSRSSAAWNQQYSSNPFYRPPSVLTPAQGLSPLTNFKPKMLRGFEPLAALEGKSFDSAVSWEIAQTDHDYAYTARIYSRSHNADNYDGCWQPIENGNWYMYQTCQRNPLYTDTSSSTVSDSVADSVSDSVSVSVSSELSEDHDVIEDSSSIEYSNFTNPTTGIHHNSNPVIVPNPAAAVSRTLNIESLLPPAILPPYSDQYPDDPPPTYEEAILEAGSTSRYFLYEDENEALWELDNIINDYIDRMETPSSAATPPATTTLINDFSDSIHSYDANIESNSRDDTEINRWSFGHHASLWFPEIHPSISWTSDFYPDNQSTDFIMY